MANSGSRVLKHAGILSIALLLCKLISFIIDFLLAHYIGANKTTDTLIASESMINLFVSFIVSPLSAAFLPVFSTIETSKDKARINTFVNSVRALLLIIAVIFCIIIYFLFDYIVKMIYPGFNVSDYALLRMLVLIQLPSVFALLLNGVNSGILRFCDKYAVPELLNKLGMMLGIIVIIIKRSNIEVQLIAGAYCIGNVLSLIIQTSITHKLKVNVFFRPKFNQDLTKLIRFTCLFLFASIVRDINVIVDKSVSSLLPSGSITILSYANKLSIAEVGLISTAISTVMLSKAARFYSANDIDGYKDCISSSLSFIVFLLLPLCIISIVFRYEIIGVLFGHGNFGNDNVVIAGDTMACYSIGMIGFGVQDVITRAMHAAQKAKYTVISSVILTASNIILNLLLYKSLGTKGIALASSISVLLVIIPLLIIFNKRFVSLRGCGIIKESLVTVISAVLAAIVYYIIYILIIRKISNDIIVLLIGLFIYVVSYLIFLVVFKSNNLNELKELVYEKFKKSKS